MTRMRLRDIYIHITRTGYISTPLPGGCHYDSHPESPREFLWHPDQLRFSKYLRLSKKRYPPHDLRFSPESFDVRRDQQNPGYYVGARHPSKAKSGMSGKFASGARKDSAPPD